MFRTIGEAIVLVVRPDVPVWFFHQHANAIGDGAGDWLGGGRDAIVVLENIYRHIEQGMPRKEAAIRGSREIGFAVVAMILTLVTVYVPLAFATGRTGWLFIEFALALAGAVLVSGFVALTLTPMMGCVAVPRTASQSLVQPDRERSECVGLSVRARVAACAATPRPGVVAIGLVVAAGSVVLFNVVKSELAPVEDRGVVFGVVSAPEGATLNYTLQNMQDIEKFYANIAETSGNQVTVGFPTVSDGTAILRLKPWNERKRSQEEIARELQLLSPRCRVCACFPIIRPRLGNFLALSPSNSSP